MPYLGTSTPILPNHPVERSGAKPRLVFLGGSRLTRQEGLATTSRRQPGKQAKRRRQNETTPARPCRMDSGKSALQIPREEDTNMPNPYDIIIKSLSPNSSFLDALKAAPNETLTKEGIDSVDRSDLLQIIEWASQGRALQGVQIEELKKQRETLLTEMQKQSKETLAVATGMKDGLGKTIVQIDGAFKSTITMYKISFYIGVILIILAVAGAFVLKETVLSITFGSLGMLDILTFFLARPQEKLQSSRASLAQMQAALYNWFIDLINQNTYLMSASQGNTLDLATVQSVSESLIAHTDKTLDMLQKSKVS
jgi:hypothetical protein